MAFFWHPFQTSPIFLVEFLDKNSATLQDVMSAMDAVDQLRHEQALLEEAIDSDIRAYQLAERLRKIYAEQSIEVSDEMLQEGVEMLEQERFRYIPEGGRFSRLLATAYIARDRWIKPVTSVAAVLALFSYVGGLFDGNLVQINNPSGWIELRSNYVTAIQLTEGQVNMNRIDATYHAGVEALEAGDTDTLANSIKQLASVIEQVESSYTLRIVRERGVASQVFRVTDEETEKREYFLIVEPVNKRGFGVAVNVRSNDDGKRYNLKRFGVEVNAELYEQVAADLADDGRIQNNVVATKVAGLVDLQYAMDVKPGVITQW